jgi:hypothetical protein
MNRRGFLSSLLALLPIPFLTRREGPSVRKNPAVDKAIDSMASVLRAPRVDMDFDYDDDFRKDAINYALRQYGNHVRFTNITND